MTRIPFLDLRLANAGIEAEVREAVCRVIGSGRYLHGEATAALERRLAQLCHRQHCVAVSNGLDALRLILLAYKQLGRVADGDEVIVPANTYIASALAVSQCGLVPRFVDADAVTMCLDPALVEEAVNARTRAIMPVHLYGTPCWNGQLRQIATDYELLVVEDNAQAIGAEACCPGLDGVTTITGGLGHAAAFSFYPTKNIGAFGDAGAVVTGDEALAAAVRALANYGSDTRYHNIYIGYNCRMDEVQAAALCVSLNHLEQESGRRGLVAKAYDDAITAPQVTRPAVLGDCRQVWHQYVIRCSQRDGLRQYLDAEGVGTDMHYPVPPHRQPCYREEYGHLSLPVAEAIAAECVSLPIAAPVDAATAGYVAGLVNRYFER